MDLFLSRGQFPWFLVRELCRIEAVNLVLKFIRVSEGVNDA